MTTLMYEGTSLEAEAVSDVEDRALELFAIGALAESGVLKEEDLDAGAAEVAVEEAKDGTVIVFAQRDQRIKSVVGALIAS